MSNLRKILYNDTEIEFLYTIKNVKNINMRVKSDGTVLVSSNKRVSLAKIDSFVLDNAEFVLKSQEKFSKRTENTSNLIKKDEFIFFLGKKLKIDVISSDIDNVEIANDTFNIYTRVLSDENIQLIAENFLNKQCFDIFSELMSKYLEVFTPFGVKKPKLVIKSLKSKWGSCTPSKNEIMLNKKLIHFDIKCIEYVVLHEYCHFFHQNHSKEFYNFLAQYMPNYKVYKNKLNNKE